MVEAFFHGVLLAFGLILPLGVQNIFIFNQGATQVHFMKAIPAIMTAAVCDTILIILAVTGVSLIVIQFDWLTNLIFIIGFIFLLYMGWSLWKSVSNTSGHQQDQFFTTKRQITFAASVSLLNPHAILDTIGVIGTSSLAYVEYEKWIFAFACIVVSWVWFFGLAITGRKVGKFDTSGQLLRRMNQVSAVIIWAMAIYMGYQAFA